jgi:diguanylate cyclase (GGDEF)-like protein
LQDESVWSGHLSVYRNIAWIIGLLIAGAMGFSGFVVFQAEGRVDEYTPAALVTFGVGALVLGVLYLGFLLLQDRVVSLTSAHSEMLASANRDSLTGALTRSLFLARLKSHVQKGAEMPVGYVQLDMDHLKQLNDSNGHGDGDVALAHLVACVRRVLPEADVGRLGGDEFGVAVPGCGSGGALKALGQQILDEYGRSLMIGGRSVHLSATMGIAMAPLHASSVDMLMSKADLALYKGKRAGGNTVTLFETDLLSDERHKRFVERELRAAILTNELELYYQPIFDSQSRALRSYESLVRWEHPVRGTIAPSEFVHIAEESDLIDKLGDWVLRRACRDLAALDAPSVAINVSAAQLRRRDFAERFSSIVEAAKVDYSRLTVEITETVPLASKGIEKTNLDVLCQLGVSIAIDDFGAGNASLAYLRGFSFGVLKIDRSYVEHIATDKFDAMLVASICRIARAAQMDVIAEGVETEQQLKILQRLGCTALQGFLLGKPQPLRKILASRVSDRSISEVA